MADVTRRASDLVPKGFVSIATAAVLAAVAACSGPVPPPATPSARSDFASVGAETTDREIRPVLSADVAFPRTLQADRFVEVQLTGAAGDGWLVTSAALESTMFSPVTPTPSNVRLFGGYVARVRVPLGEAICSAGTGEAIAHLTLKNDGGAGIDGTVTDGKATDTEVTVNLPPEVLAGINADECATRAVTDAASPSLGAPEATLGTTVETTLTLTRGEAGDGAEVSLTGMRGSVVFDMSPRGGFQLPTLLAVGDRSLAVPVDIVATRCDPHVFAESKKTFVFAVWLSIDGGPERYVELRPDAALEDALQAAFDACGEGADAQTPGAREHNPALRTFVVG